jgi:hypothetical protein
MSNGLQEAVEEVLRQGSCIDQEAAALLEEAEGVPDPGLRASVKDVAKEAMTNWGNSADAMLDMWNSGADVPVKQVTDLLAIMRDFRQEVANLRSIIRA